METKKIAAMAEAYNMRVAPHNCASALSTAASLQVAACIANFMIQEIYPYFPNQLGYIQVLENSPEDVIRNSHLTISAEPGLGVRLARPFAPYRSSGPCKPRAQGLPGRSPQSRQIPY